MLFWPSLVRLDKSSLIYQFIEEARSFGATEDEIAISIVTGPMIDMSNRSQEGMAGT
jgi:hypothetical protein